MMLHLDLLMLHLHPSCAFFETGVGCEQARIPYVLFVQRPAEEHLGSTGREGKTSSMAHSNGLC